MKVIPIVFIMENEIESYLLNEKKVMQIVDFPFIMKFYRSFLDEQHVYFMNEYINGIDLYTIMCKIGLLNTY